MAVDLSVFDKQKTVLDQQALQEAFQLKKALAVQAAQRDALEMQALQAQAANGGLTLKDMLTMQLQQQSNQANQDIRRESLEDRRSQYDIQRQALADKAEEARQKKIEAEAERYGKSLESTGLTDLISATDRAANVIAGEGDIAGYGMVTNALPGVVLSQAGKNNRQEISGLKNTLLKARSGGAVTPQEGERLGSEIGDNVGSDDNQLRKGVSNIASTLADKLANAQAGFSPEAIKLYESRGGIGSGFVQKYRKPSTARTVVKTQISPSTGKRKIIYSDGTEEIQ